MKKHNFFAGPAILPATVIAEAANAVQSFGDMGLSLIEISHRSKPFVAVMEEAQALTKELLGLSDEYAVLFLQGGASMQFTMTAYNLLSENGTGAYLDTGSWANKAAKEAAIIGHAAVVASSADTNYNYIPTDFSVPAETDYFHITTNNTIYGTAINNLQPYIKAAQQNNIPLIADMSSDIFSRPIPANDFGLIYAGAQKNLGPAGTTLVILRKDILGKTNRSIPTMLNYQTHIDKDSMFNTPPVFAVYTSMLTMRWIKQNGGLAAMQARNEKKASLLYNEIDRNSLFSGTAAKGDRSLMNATFVMTAPALEAAFLDTCAEAGLVGLKGHRSVGGFRASIYNAMELESVQVLVDVMQAFEKQNG